MTKEELSKAVEEIIAQRKKDPEFKHPDMKTVQALIGQAITCTRHAGLGILPQHNIKMADMYLSLARGDTTPFEQGRDN